MSTSSSSSSGGIVIKTDDYGAAVAKLVAANNRSRAHKLVDVLDDTAHSRTGVAVILMLALVIRIVVWGGGITLCVYLALRLLG